MMSFRTFLCMMLAIGSGYFLYTKKHETSIINDKIKQTIQEINQTKEMTARLRTKWVLENQPNRLKRLTKIFIPYLKNTKTEQYVSIRELKNRLPPIQFNIVSNNKIKKENLKRLKELP